MLLGIILMITLFIILSYVLTWIRYFNSLDPRLGQSTWRWSYDYPVIGLRDFSDLDNEKGLYTNILKVYFQKEDPLGNKVIKEQTKDKRTTHWVPEIQI